jgi:hypothetical protein
MKTTLAFCALLALLLQLATTAPAQNAPASQPAIPARPAQLAALEKLLLRTWQGPDCGGDFTFKPDGTFEVQHYTPANHTLAGTWSLRWDALPPTLLLNFKTSDFKKRDPAGPEYQHIGKTLEAKLLELNPHTLAFQVPNSEWNWHNLAEDDK